MKKTKKSEEATEKPDQVKTYYVAGDPRAVKPEPRRVEAIIVGNTAFVRSERDPSRYIRHHKDAMHPDRASALRAMKLRKAWHVDYRGDIEEVRVFGSGDGRKAFDLHGRTTYAPGSFESELAAVRAALKRKRKKLRDESKDFNEAKRTVERLQARERKLQAAHSARQAESNRMVKRAMRPAK